MTASVEREPAQRPGRAKRRFQILVGVVVAIALLWTGAWFAARHYVAGKIAAIEARAEAEGATLACSEQGISGFPFRIAVTCTKLAASCPAEEAGIDLAGIEATALIYNPGHALLAAKGPLALKGPDGIALDADWTQLQSSLRLGFSGLKRYSLVTDAFAASLAAPGRLDAPLAVRADHAELHLVPDPADDGFVDLFTSFANGTVTMPGQPALPPVTADIEVDLPRAVVLAGGDRLAAWIASGQPIHLRRLVVDLAGFSAALAGDATIGADGLLTGDFTVRLTALDRLPDLVEQIRPGSRDRVARMIAPLSMMLKPVSADGRDWREARIRVDRGRATMGFIPLGRIPPLGHGNAPMAAADDAPAVAAAAPPAEPAPPAAPAPSPEMAAASPAAPAAPAPSAGTATVDPADARAAAGAIRDLAGAFRSRRCAVAGS